MCQSVNHDVHLLSDVHDFPYLDVIGFLVVKN